MTLAQRKKAKKAKRKRQAQRNASDYARVRAAERRTQPELFPYKLSALDRLFNQR